MPLTRTSLLDFSASHFLDKQGHVAIVCAGPRSEQWFNGEVRIALNERYAKGTWKWVTVEKTIDGGRIDVFAMDGENDNQADGAIEGKHAQHDDADPKLREMCEELQRQMTHRSSAFPVCPVIGLIYVTFTYQVSDEDEANADEDGISCPVIETEASFYQRVRSVAIAVFGDTAVSEPRVVFNKGHAAYGNWRLLTSMALIAVGNDAA